MELPVSFLRKQESRSHIRCIPYQARNDILYSDYGDTTLALGLAGWPLEPEGNAFLIPYNCLQ
jgi:hypothetical protein